MMEHEEDRHEEERPEPKYHTWDDMYEVGMGMSDFV